MKSKFLLGLLAGVAAGATLGILFTSIKGGEMRKKTGKGAKGSAAAEQALHSTMHAAKARATSAGAKQAKNV